jgi:molybdopterin converting factor subunit 1
MRIKLLFFGRAKELSGTGEVALELPKGTTTTDLMGIIARDYPKTEPVLPSVVLAVNQEYTEGTVALSNGDEVACIPPISGG